MAISKIENASLASGVPQRSQLPVGTVLQVVQSFYKTAEVTSTSTWAATAFSASITPTSASSKILVFVSAVVSTSSDNYGGFRIYRNGSQVTDANSNQATGSAINAFLAIVPTGAATWTNTISNSYLDSPASASAQTYTMWWARTYNSGNIYLNRPTTLDTGNSYSICAPSSITLMEIAA